MVDSEVIVGAGFDKPKVDRKRTALRRSRSFRCRGPVRPPFVKSAAVLPGDVNSHLHRAVMAGDAKLVARLVADLSAGCAFELSALDGEGLTVMHQAVFAASLPVLDVLLRHHHGGNIDEIRDEEGCTLLHAAAMVGNCLLAGWLIKEGASVMVIDSDGQLPIDLADGLGMQELLLQAMHRAGYIGLALHYKSRLQEHDDGDDSDYGTASSMSSLTLGDSDQSDDDCDPEETDFDDGDRLPVDNCQEEGSLATAANSDGQADCEKAADYTHRCALQLSPKPSISLAEGVITKSPIQINPTNWPEGVLFRTQGGAETCVYTVRRPFLQLARVEFLPTMHRCTGLDSGCGGSDCQDQGLNKRSAPFRSPLSRVLNCSQTPPAVQECTTTAPSSTSSERSGSQQVVESDSNRVHPVAVLSKTRPMVPSKPVVSIRRSQTVSEADIGWVSGTSTPNLSCDAGCKTLLRRSMLSGCEGRRRHIRPKNVSFPIEVLMTDAIGVGDVDEVRLLLEAGAVDINSFLPAGLTALHLAVLCRQQQIVQLLLTHGASVDCVDIDGWKPLHAAAREGTVPVTNTLLENGADPFVLTLDGQTALALASNDNVRLVLRNAMDRAVQSAAQTTVETMSPTPASAADEQSKSGLCRNDSCTDARKARLNTKAVSFSPCVLLRQAIIDGNCEEVRSLLEESDTVIALNSIHLGGVTALHQAVLEEQTEVVRVLLNDKRVDLNLRDTDGWTAMHAAAAIGATSIVELLIAAGASASMTTTDGQLPVNLTDNDHIATLLREHSVPDVNI